MTHLRTYIHNYANPFSYLYVRTKYSPNANFIVFFTFSPFVLLDLVVYISFPVGSREVACKLKTVAVKISQHINNESNTRLVPHFLSVQCFYFVV